MIHLYSKRINIVYIKKLFLVLEDRNDIWALQTTVGKDLGDGRQLFNDVGSCQK